MIVSCSELMTKYYYIDSPISSIKNIEIFGVVIFKILFFFNQRGEKKSISDVIFVLHIIKHR